MLWRSSEKSIRLSVQNAIQRAASKSYKSIAFPLIGAGTGGKKQTSVRTIMQYALQRLDYEGQVRIVKYRHNFLPPSVHDKIPSE